MSLQHKQLLVAQQKRFEQILKRPENRECFDCQAKQPRWASTNLGIFFCLRCAGIHRSLGVHISKVKSTTMDLWEQPMVQCCDRIGNSNGKMLYEAHLPSTYRKPEPSTDTTVVERLLRQKYEQKSFYPADFEELRERMLAASPHASAPTPVQTLPVTPTTMAPVPVTPTFSVGAASPCTGGGNVPPDAAADWTGFQTSPVTPARSSIPAKQQPQRGGHNAEVDIWGDFASASQQPAPQGDIFGAPTPAAAAPLRQIPAGAGASSSTAAHATMGTSIDDLFSSPVLSKTTPITTTTNATTRVQQPQSSDLLDFRGSCAPRQVTIAPLPHRGSSLTDQSSPAAIMAMFGNAVAPCPPRSAVSAPPLPAVLPHQTTAQHINDFF